jgi:hypothetical protein
MGLIERVTDDFAVPGLRDVDHGSEQPSLFDSWDTFKTGVAAAARQNIPVVSFATAKDRRLPPHREEGFRAWDLIKGTDLEPYRRQFFDVHNSEAFAMREAQIRAGLKDRKFLDALPWWQKMAVEFPASLADPTTFLPGGTLVRSASGGFSVARTAAKRALLGSAGTAIQEGALHWTQPTRELGDSV